MTLHDNKIFSSSFLEEDMFQSLSGEEMKIVALAVFSFLKYDVVTTKQASLLYYMGLLQISPVRNFKYKKIILAYCCFRFTAKGSSVAQELLTFMGLSVADLESLQDIFETDLAKPDSTLKFIMHDRRLRKELAEESDRTKAVQKKYAMKFEEELEPHLLG